MENLEKDISNDIWTYSDRFGSYSWSKISNDDFVKLWRAKNLILLKENLGIIFFFSNKTIKHVLTNCLEPKKVLRSNPMPIKKMFQI